MLPAGRPLVLASASPRRSDLLREAGYVFEIVPANVDELVGSTPHETVLGNAHRKARAIAELRPDALVLGVDTEVWFGGRVFGKPANVEDAFRMLSELNGHQHEVYSGVAFAWVDETGVRREHGFVDVSCVRFHHCSDEELRAYLERIRPLDKAGAYAAQDDAGEMIAEVQGSYTNVIGLPMEALGRVLPAQAQEPRG